MGRLDSMATKKSRDLSPDHKAAMATGRSESAVVKRYLEALETNKPKRGRKRTPDSIQKRLAVIDATLDGADPLQRLNLIQERKDLENEVLYDSVRAYATAVSDLRSAAASLDSMTYRSEQPPVTPGSQPPP